MQLPKLSPAMIRIIGISLLIVAVAVAIKTGTIQNLSRQIRATVWHSPTPWSLEIEQSFFKCGHHLHLENTYPSETAIRGFLKRHSEYQLTGEHAVPGRTDARAHNHLWGREDLNDFCPTCRTQQFFGIRDQQVVVLRGTPRQPGPVKEKTTIQLRLMPTAELADLQKGIPFKDDKDKLQIIEGLNGLVTN